MVKKCLYCSCELSDDNIIDFCEKCGRGVFGDKMLKAIIQNMENAREKGDLHQGILSFRNKDDSDSKLDEKAFKV